MAAGTVYARGWTIDDIDWSKFDHAKVQPWLLAAVKAAALIEFNAPDYVGYLKRVFEGGDAATLSSIEQWGCEERQHGRALGRWAEMADPNFKLEEAFARFQAGYRPAHLHANEAISVRGSRRGEMIARCVVESGTSSYYTAMRDVAEEPVLKEIASRIASDEYRHYRLFLDTLNAQVENDLPLWRKIFIAMGRISESDDDELSYAFYCASVPSGRAESEPYERRRYAHLSFATGMRIYRPHHIRKLTQMVAMVIGAHPQGWLARFLSAATWQMMRLRAGFLSAA